MKAQLPLIRVIASMTLGLLVPLIALPQGADHLKTTRTGAVPVPHARGNCTDNKFIHDGGCAGYGSATAYLPLGAQVMAIRAYSNDGGTEGDGPLHYVGDGSSGHELSWAYMYPIGQKTTANNTVVWFDYANRSDNRVRSIALEVDWK
jgi:hypothetical protein